MLHLVSRLNSKPYQESRTDGDDYNRQGALMGTVPGAPDPIIGGVRGIFSGTQIASRRQTVGEEIANTLSHGAGLVAALVAAPVLVGEAVRRGGAAGIAAAAIFAATVVIMYLSSTIYHSLPPGRVKRVAQVVDHSAIYLLIAGTYTPFTLGILRGVWGWSLLAIVWVMALAGLILKASAGVRYPTASLLFYVGMAWAGIIAVRPLWLSIEPWGLFWLLAGGASYMIGVIFFIIDERLRFSHFIWHLFVLGGTACHYVAVLYFSS